MNSSNKLNSDFSVEFVNYSLFSDYACMLNNISFSLSKGKSMAVIGPAGAGKTILLSVIGQLFWNSHAKNSHMQQEGSCKIIDYQVSPHKPSTEILNKIRAKIVYITEISSWLPITIAENFYIAQKYFGVNQNNSYTEIIANLPISKNAKLRLERIAELLPAQVESTTLQQLAIVRALLRKPEILLLDEPCLRMDPVLLKQTEALVSLLTTEKTSVIWATNDLYQASKVTDWTLLISAGRMVEFTETPQFFTNPQTQEAENFILGREE